MRIGVDARWLEHAQRAGVARYLLSILQEFGRDSAGHQYVLFSRAPLPEAFLGAPPFEQVHFGRSRYVDGLTWGDVLLPRALKAQRADVLLSPAYFTPIVCRTKRVVVLHDISFQAHPEWFSPRDRVTLRTLARLSARTADAVITDSCFQKQEIVEHYHVAESRVHAIPLAVTDQFAPVEDPARLAAVRAKYGISGPYILHVGLIFARRNLPVLLRAFRDLAVELPHSLVVVGPNRTLPYEDLDDLARRLGVRHRTVFVEFADDEDMAPLYAGADVSAYLSSYEGFGLPALESLACGTPVVASDRSSVPEVVGSAGVLVDPTDPDVVGAALRSILADPERREALRRASLAQAATFSWQRTARGTLDVLEQAHAG
jgi:glycosyltransferase involved in cell wall biosynthesis